MAENSTAFDAANPPLKITNPGGVKGYHEYPRHLYDAQGTACVVASDAEKAEKLGDGWFLTVADAQAAAVPKKKAAA